MKIGSHGKNEKPDAALIAKIKAEIKRLGGNEKDFEIEKLLPKKNPVK